MVPNNRLQERLFSNPPVFEIDVTNDRTPGIMFVDIGSFKMWFEFDFDNDAEAIGYTIITRLQPLVPPSVTTLIIGCYGLALAELEWREFVISEVRSIKCSNRSGEPVSGLLWDALSPTVVDAVPPCQKLESVSLLGDQPSTRLLNCLLNRKNAGLELKYLEARDVDVIGGLAGEFGRLVERLDAPVYKPKDELAREVRPIQ